MGAQILTDPAHLHRLITVDHGRNASELREGIADPWTRAVNGRLGLAGGGVVGAPVQLHPLGHGDLDRRREPTSRPLVAPDLLAHRQPRVVFAQFAAPIRITSHEARMACTPVEVGVTGQLQTPRRGAIEVAVDRRATARQRVRAVTHALLAPGAVIGSAPEDGFDGTTPPRGLRYPAGWRRAPSRRRRLPWLPLVAHPGQPRRTPMLSPPRATPNRRGWGASSLPTRSTQSEASVRVAR